MISFFILFIAGCFEVAGVSTLNGFANSKNFNRKAIFFLLTIIFFGFSLSFLSLSMQEIPLSVAYAIWTGIGTIGAVLVGVLINGDKISAKKGISILLIIVSAIMLKLI
ncbi:multidrug efflux SMR transporter [Acinetobacter pittii]|uniref:multidrug efflux SMR transporter n=1 Tax=Acinetobacter pittii TaxID=48296 RepID=UPI0034CDB368